MGSAPKFPPQPDYSKMIPKIPPIVMPSFEMPETPTYDPEAVERKKQQKRDEELAAIVARKERGREGTVKTGPLGLPNDETRYPVRRPGLVSRPVPGRAPGGSVR